MGYSPPGRKESDMTLRLNNKTDDKGVDGKDALGEGVQSEGNGCEQRQTLCSISDLEAVRRGQA